MQSEGQWMMVTPFLRRAATTGLAFLAMASQRFVAQSHQCLSQTSQMTRAVSLAARSFLRETSSNSSEPLNVSTRLRRFSESVSGFAAGLSAGAAGTSRARLRRQRRRGMGGSFRGVKSEAGLLAELI